MGSNRNSIVTKRIIDERECLEMTGAVYHSIQTT